MKLSKPFQFTYTKYERTYVGRDKQTGKSLWKMGAAVCSFPVSGIAYCDTSVSPLDIEDGDERYTVDIEYIHAGALEVLVNEVDIVDVIDFCCREAAMLFTDKNIAA